MLLYILDLRDEDNANAFDHEDFWKTAGHDPNCKGFYATTYREAIEAFNRLTGDNVYLPKKRLTVSQRAARGAQTACGVAAVILRGMLRMSVIDVDEQLEDGDIIVLLELFC